MFVLGNTPGTAGGTGGPGGRDQTLAIKSRKMLENQFFSRKKVKIIFLFFGINLLVMPKYWGKQIFAHGRFPEVGKKQKTEERERKKERLNDGDNNARKHTWRTQAAWAKKTCFNNGTR